ncbi:MAG: aminopeptidase P family protein [Candidatus Palauibacterales bacterium]|nr:aminopeptidase P family protein [Candidatus Palauibacterales bacterium]
MFEASTYIDRRKGLQERVGSGLLLFLGNDPATMNYPDNPFHFRQDSSFLYYFGLDQAGLAGVIDADSGEEILFGHEPTVDEIVWTGPLPTLTEERACVGVGRSEEPEKLGEVLRTARDAGRTIHFLPQYRAWNRIKLARMLGIPGLETDEHVSRSLIEAVVDQRLYKSDEEVAEIEIALDMSYDMHTLAMHMVRPGMVEREVAGAVEGVVLSRGGLTSFPIIFSVRGEVLHNHTYENVMKDGQLAVHDSGATSPMGYASDITRTMPVSGRFDTRQREIYDLVLRALTTATAAMRPGIPFRDVHFVACKVIASGLKDLGILKGDVDEAVAAGAHAICMPHGLGHMMGLDVHDMEGLDEDLVGYGTEFERSTQFGTAYLRAARTLESGFVLTVEPGCYFIPQLIDQWRAQGTNAEFLDFDRLDSYKGFGGVRIEDDVLVTTDGHRILGRRIPKTADEVEEQMGANE